MGFAVSASFTERGILARKQQMLAQQIAAPVIKQIVDAQQAEAREARMALMFQAAHAMIDIDVIVPAGQRIMREIADQHGFTPAQIRGPRRYTALIEARQHAVYEVARLCPDLSLKQIGNIFKRDHSTVIHALKAWPAKAEHLGIECLPLDGRATHE